MSTETIRVRPPSRRLVQPGPVDPNRIESTAAPLIAARFSLAPGLTLIDAIAGPVGRFGLRAAALDLSGMVLGPMQFVKPAYSRTEDHVAYYSETYRHDGAVRIDHATATFGFRDSAPFLHCHALWRDADGRACGGHILASDTLVAAASEVEVRGTDRIALLSRFDPETNFTLFGLEHATTGRGPLVVARVRPNEDLVEAIETVAARHDLRDAIVRSLIGSTVGGRFDDGRVVEEIPTEIVALSGRVRRRPAGGHAVDLDIALIDADGNILRGQLTRGENPVLICVELFLEERAGETGET